MWSIVDIASLFANGNGFKYIDGTYVEDTSSKDPGISLIGRFNENDRLPPSPLEPKE